MVLLHVTEWCCNFITTRPDILHLDQVEGDTLRAQLKKVKIKLGIIEDDRDVCEAKTRDLKADNNR